jgi:hypothetical protein
MYMLGIAEVLAGFTGPMIRAVAVPRLYSPSRVRIQPILIAAILLVAFPVMHGFCYGCILSLRRGPGSPLSHQAKRE